MKTRKGRRVVVFNGGQRGNDDWFIEGILNGVRYSYERDSSKSTGSIVVSEKILIPSPRKSRRASSCGYNI